MIADIYALSDALRGFAGFTAITATAFPFLYAFSPWYKTALGRAMMLQGVAFAAVMDLRFVFSIWDPGREVYLWVSVITLALVAAATTTLTVILWNLNYTHRRNTSG